MALIARFEQHAVPDTGTDPNLAGWARPSRRDSAVATAPLVLAVGLWIAAVHDVDLNAMSDIGLISVVPWPAFVALVLLLSSFVWALFSHSYEAPRWLPAAHVAALAMLLHATPTLLYGTLRYSWAYKHVGIVDYIQRQGAVDPNIDVLSVYHNWPAFFALNAMLTRAGGLESALSYAAWAPPFFSLLSAAVVALIARELLDDDRTVVLASALFVLTNWVGQDYFAPQALAYFWYLVVLFVVLRWLGRPSRRFPRVVAPQWIHKLTPSWRSPAGPADLRWYDRRLQTSLTNPTPREWVGDVDRILPGTRVALLAVVVLLVWSIVSVHQLTPVALTVALVALLLGSRLYLGMLPLLVAVLTVEWLIDVAVPFTRANLAEVARAVGDVEGNVTGTLIGYGQVSDGQMLVSSMARGLSVSIGLLAVLGFYRSLRRERLAPVALLAIAPVALIAVSGYGSEVLFRIFLFALPFVVIIAAAGLIPPRRSARRPARTAVLLAVLALAAMFLFAYYGNERQYRFTPGEVAAARFVYEHAPEGALLIEGSRNYPAQFRNYERFVYVPLDREPVSDRQRIVSAPVQELERWLSDEQYSQSYMIITRSQKAATNALGDLPHDGLEDIEQALAASPRFQRVYGNADASVFMLRDRDRAAEENV